MAEGKLSTDTIPFIVMEQTELFTELIIAVGAAFAGGLLARALRLPVLIGYILGGVAVALISPQVGLRGLSLGTVAELGVALLMFIIGLELSLRYLLEVGRVIVWIGILQIILTSAVGILIGAAFGESAATSVVLGFAIALSSTAVVLKSLQDHGQVQTKFGQVMLGILITQDLAVIVMLATLPILSQFSPEKLSSLVLAVLRSILFLAVAIVVASKLIPRLLDGIARAGNRELFALTVTAISFAAAFATYKLGFSVALGAFVAGVIVSESEYTHQVFADIAPLRDIFAAVFFVTVGATFNAGFFVASIGQVAITLAAVIAGKFIIIALLCLLFKLHHKVAFLTGVGLAQMGEFSFLIAQQGVRAGAIGPAMYNLILTVTLLSLLLTPLLIYLSPRMYWYLANLRWLYRLRGAEEHEDEYSLPLRKKDHVIILGFGNVGKLVGAGLHAHKIPYVVIDYDRDTVRRARSRGIDAVFGDAANPLVIKQADPRHARAAVVALPDTLDTWRALRYLKEASPEMPVIARAATELDIGRLYAEGAEEVIQPRFEAGLEILRHLLTLLRVAPEELEMFLEHMRHWEPPHRAQPAA